MPAEAAERQPVSLAHYAQEQVRDVASKFGQLSECPREIWAIFLLKFLESFAFFSSAASCALCFASSSESDSEISFSSSESSSADSLSPISFERPNSDGLTFAAASSNDHCSVTLQGCVVEGRAQCALCARVWAS